MSTTFSQIISTYFSSFPGLQKRYIFLLIALLSASFSFNSHPPTHTLWDLDTLENQDGGYFLGTEELTEVQGLNFQIFFQSRNKEEQGRY